MLPINPFIILAIGTLLIFLLIVFLLSILQRTRIRKQLEHDSYIKYLEDVIASKKNQLNTLDIEINKKKDNIDFFLNWMLENSVITPEEYNRLLLKSLPYL